jgi:hypothetical protein
VSGGRGLATRLLSSPRRRRRLRLSAALLALAGVLAFVGLKYSNTAEREPEHFSKGPVQRVSAPLKAQKLSNIDLESVHRIAELFIDTAVLRTSVDDSWEITTPKLRQGLTRKEWDSGNIPVTPFPAGAVQQIKYTLDWSGQDLVYLKVAILPKDAANVAGQAFDIGLARDAHSGPDGWLVDYWVPTGLGSPSPAQRTAAAKSAAAAPPASESLPQGLILIPVGVLILLVVGLPLGLFGRNYARSRRALREYRRHSA